MEIKDGTHVAKTVLMPGDPLRAKFVAETYLENPVLFNDVRGMLGYTGTFEGKEISVMGSGMGVPSMVLYAHELFTFFDGIWPLEEAVERIKGNTRRYCRKQLTWFKRDETIKWFSPNNIEEIINYIESVVS